MNITDENKGHVQEILDRYGVSGLNDLDQRLFEWNEANLRTYEVTIPKTVKFRIRVSAVSTHAAIDVANNILDIDKVGPSEEHGTYEIVGPPGEVCDITSAVEVRNA